MAIFRVGPGTIFGLFLSITHVLLALAGFSILCLKGRPELFTASRWLLQSLIFSIVWSMFTLTIDVTIMVLGRKIIQRMQFIWIGHLVLALFTFAASLSCFAVVHFLGANSVVCNKLYPTACRMMVVTSAMTLCIAAVNGVNFLAWFVLCARLHREHRA